MSKCKVCGKIIDDDITFKNIFRINNYYHSRCKQKIKINNTIEIIPTVFGYMSYLSKYYNNNFNNLIYFEEKSYKFFEKILNKTNPINIIIIIDKVVLDNLEYEEIYLLSALSKESILMVSLLYVNLIEYEYLFH